MLLPSVCTVVGFILMFQKRAIGELFNRFGLIGFYNTSLTLILSIFHIIGIRLPLFVNLFCVLIISSMPIGKRQIHAI
jgi:hypothetical protein